MQGQYYVITLCGSTRFKNEFMEVQKRLTGVLLSTFKEGNTSATNIIF